MDIQYRVCIPYREPAFEERIHRAGGKPYEITMIIEAESESSAIQLALKEFKQDAKNSSVHWMRVPDLDNITVNKVKEKFFSDNINPLRWIRGLRDAVLRKYR